MSLFGILFFSENNLFLFISKNESNSPFSILLMCLIDELKSSSTEP